jgi:hypothetical protein
MAENPTPNAGGQPAVGPSFGQSAPRQPTRRSGAWLPIALAALATVVAIAALVVALTRPSGSSASSTTPTYTDAQISAAQKQLCDTYKQAAQAVQTETNGTDKALARIAVSNSAGMLDDAAANQALDAKFRDPARALATAYRTSNAVGSVGTDAQYRAAVDDIVAKDAAMRQVCANVSG